MNSSVPRASVLEPPPQARKEKMKTAPKKTYTASVSHSCYEVCQRAGVLHFGRALRAGHRFTDERKEAARKSCRGKGGHDE